MSFVSRGFHRRHSEPDQEGRVPPGQYVTPDFPVLSAGPTPRRPLESWSFSIEGEVDEPLRWSWDEFRALPSEEITKDIHCVTKWSKLDTHWQGVSVETLLDGVETSAEFVVAFSDGGYTTNLPLEDLTRRQGVGRFRLRRRAARARARRAGAAAGAAPVLLEEREVGARAAAARGRRAGLLGGLRLPQLRRSMARAAVRGRLTWQLAEVVESIEETPRVRSLVLRAPAWAGHRAGQHVDIRLTAEDGYQVQRSYSIASRAGGRVARAHGRAAGRRRGLALPRRRAPARRPARAARPDRRLFRLGRLDGRPLAARRRRLGNRPADGDPAASRRQSAAMPRCGCSPPGGRQATSSTRPSSSGSAGSTASRSSTR